MQFLLSIPSTSHLLEAFVTLLSFERISRKFIPVFSIGNGCENAKDAIEACLFARKKCGCRIKVSSSKLVLQDIAWCNEQYQENPSLLIPVLRINERKNPLRYFLNAQRLIPITQENTYFIIDEEESLLFFGTSWRKLMPQHVAAPAQREPIMSVADYYQMLRVPLLLLTTAREKTIIDLSYLKTDDFVKSTQYADLHWKNWLEGSTTGWNFPVFYQDENQIRVKIFHQNAKAKTTIATKNHALATTIDAFLQNTTSQLTLGQRLLKTKVELREKITTKDLQAYLFMHYVETISLALSNEKE